MKIAIVGAEMLPLPAVKGGSIEEALDGVTPFLSKDNDLTVISPTDPQLPATEVRNGVKYVRFPARNYRYSVAAYLRESAFDVIDVCNRPRNVSLYKKAAPSAKYVVSLHNPMFAPAIMPETEGLQCIKNVERIITVSNYLAGTVYQRFPGAKSKLKTVYFGVDPNRYHPVWTVRRLREQMRHRYGLTNKKVIIWAGRVIPKKGPHLLVEAFKILAGRDPDVALVIVGSPWYSDDSPTDYLRRLHAISKPVKDRIIFTGFIPQTEMPGYYVMGDVYVCTSQWQEPAARTHYEAMACGLPVVTTNRGGIPEIVTDLYNGIIIKNYRNPAAFAKALGYLLANPEKAQELGRRGRQTVEKRFTFARTVQNLEKVYYEVFGRGR